MLLKDGGEQPRKARLKFRSTYAVDDRHPPFLGADQPALPQNAVVVGDGGGRHVAAGLRAVHLALRKELGDDRPSDGVSECVKNTIQTDVVGAGMLNGASHAP